LFRLEIEVIIATLAAAIPKVHEKYNNNPLWRNEGEGRGGVRKGEEGERRGRRGEERREKGRGKGEERGEREERRGKREEGIR
jgi:hypothetical protein